MKKIITTILILAMVLALYGCAIAEEPQSESATEPATESATEPEPEPTESVAEPEPTETIAEPEPSETVAEPELTEAVVEPPVTESPVTDPAEVTLSETKPVVTEPPLTEAPETEPADTTPPALVIPENGEIMEGAPYPDPLALTSFSNVTELYEYLKNMTDEELDKILAQEQWYLWDTVQTIHVSKDELQHGIFGYFRDSILTSGAVAVPHYNGSPMVIMEGGSIELETAGSYRKTSIIYPTEQKIVFNIIKYDSELVDEATEKGTAWLIKELNPNHMNLHNYKELISRDVANGVKGVKDLTVYEKEYELGDRIVKALVYDNSVLSDELLATGMKPTLETFFVYDDMLIKLLGRPDDIMNVLPGLTFEEVKVDS